MESEGRVVHKLGQKVRLRYLLAETSRMRAAAADRMIDPRMREQMELTLDNERIEAYCDAHPEAFGGCCSEWDPLRMVVYLAGDLDAHRRALEPVLDHPDRLELRPARYLERELRSIQEAVIAHCEAAGVGCSGGRGVQTVSLAVPPGAEHLAEEVVARFGDVIEIEPWPGERRKLLPGR